jgi:hypothetical protein
LAAKATSGIRDLIPRLRQGERCGGKLHLIELITGIPGIHPPDDPADRAHRRPTAAAADRSVMTKDALHVQPWRS